jgi:hypothetical protein
MEDRREFVLLCILAYKTNFKLEKSPPVELSVILYMRHKMRILNPYMPLNI